MAKSIIILLLAVSTFLSCRSGSADLSVNRENESFELKMGRLFRQGEIFIPSTYDSSKEYSLLFGLHGMGGTGAGFRSFGFDEYAERLGFIVVYPDAIDGRWEILPGEDGVKNDLDFFRVMIEEFSKLYSIDNERIYISGHSNGGYMAYRLGRELAPLIAAIAPLAGLAIETDPEIFEKKVSLLHLHALDDEVVPYEGFSMSMQLSAQYSVYQWLDYNDLHGEFERTEIPGIAVYDILRDEKEGISAALCSYFTGGHGVLPGSAFLISDFFYNHPARGNKISFGARPGGGILYNDESVVIRPSIENREEILSMGLYDGETLLIEAEEGKYMFYLEPEINRAYNLHIVAQMKDGTTLASSDNLPLHFVRENLSFGANVYSSVDEAPSLGADQAIDGSLLTRWASSYDDQNFLIVDLKEEKTVSSVTLFWEAAYGRKYSIDISVDGKKWDSVYIEQNGSGEIEYISFDPVAARFVRMNGIERATEWGYSLWEFMVH